MQRFLYFTWLLALSFLPSLAFGGIGDSPSATSKTYGPPQRGQPNMLNVGGQHIHYQSAVLNTIIKIEAVFLDRKCVGIRYEAIPLIPDEKMPLTPTIANVFLEANYGKSNWRLDNTKTSETGKFIYQEYVHRRFFHTALWDGKSLTIWAKNGLLNAAQAPLE